MNNTIAPVQHKDREVFMDILRGLAIFGILIANLTVGGLGLGPNELESGPFLWPEWDHKLDFIYGMFIEGKFYSIFSLLFGWGIALQIQRGMDKGVDPMPTLKRRLMFMVLLGSFHMLIWPGDIVLFYALLGFLLLPMRRFSDKTLLITGTVLVLSPIVLYTAKYLWPILNAPASILNDTGERVFSFLLNINSEAEYIAWNQTTGWWGILKTNMAGFFYRFGYLLFVSRISKVFGMFLIGFVLGRSNFYKNLDQNKKTVYWIIGLGLLIGLPANYMLAYYTENFGSDYYQLKLNGIYQTIAYALGVAPLALAYTGILMLSFQTQAGKKVMGILAPVGKMAFTNYISHSLVASFFFLGAGLGYGGQLGTACLTLFAIALYSIQIIGSTLWLHYFHFGPAEWIWRSLTYWKWQPAKKAGVVVSD